VRSVAIDIFKTAHDIVGGGKFGPKYEVHTKEDADHSLPYLTAVALLDGDVWPEQLTPERISRSDVQQLLRKVVVHPRRTYTWEYPRRMDCSIRVTLRNGKPLSVEKQDFEGFNTRPMEWRRVCEKFQRLASPHLSSEGQERICDAVSKLERISVAELTHLVGAESLKS
jgi:2-methylcitrate dehydratase